MHNNTYLKILFISILLASISFAQDKNRLYQYSIISSLMEGNYDGDISIGELKEEGNTGLGTLNNLDGELIIIDGSFYQVNSIGKVKVVPDESLSPFAVITNFIPEQKIPLKEFSSMNEITSKLDEILESVNYIYAFKITGTFNYIKTRSVPAQQKPYKKLVEVTKTQPTFEYENIEGTLIGFRFPSYSEGINVPGYHFHFLSDDKKSGGHVLEVKTKEVQVEFSKQHSIKIDFPSDEGFMNIDLSKRKAEDLIKAEK